MGRATLRYAPPLRHSASARRPAEQSGRSATVLPGASAVRRCAFARGAPFDSTTQRAAAAVALRAVTRVTVVTCRHDDVCDVVVQVGYTPRPMSRPGKGLSTR